MGSLHKQIKCPNCKVMFLKGKRCKLCGYKMERWEYGVARNKNARWGKTFAIIGAIFICTFIVSMLSGLGVL